MKKNFEEIHSSQGFFHQPVYLDVFLILLNSYLSQKKRVHVN